MSNKKAYLHEEFPKVSIIKPEYVKELRKKTGLTQVKAASVCGVSIRQWQYYEEMNQPKGESRHMRMIYAERFADKTGETDYLRELILKQIKNEKSAKATKKKVAKKSK